MTSFRPFDRENNSQRHHAEVEKIARSAGVHKELADDMLQTVVKDFWAAAWL